MFNNPFSQRKPMKLSKKILLALGILLSVGFLFQSGIVSAEDYGLGATAQEAGVPTNRNLQQLAGDIIGTALSFISVVFFMLMIYGGFLWMTARGNSDQEGKARDTIFGAVIGIIIVLAAYAITSFVFDNLGPNGSSGGAVTPVATASNCTKNYGTYGLSCKSKSTCASGQASKTIIDKAGDEMFANSDIEAVTSYEPDPDDVNVKAYIQFQCPGNADIVCCL